MPCSSIPRETVWLFIRATERMPFLGEICALITAFLWSGTSLVFSEAARRVGSIQVNVTRMLLAAVLLAITIAIAGWDIRLSTTQLLYLCASGVVGLALGDSFLFRAFNDVGPRISMLIMSLVPAMTSFLAYLTFGESLSAGTLTGLAVTTAGIALVVLGGHTEGGISLRVSGLFAAFMGALGQSIGLILAKKAFAVGEVNGFVATFIRLLAALLLFLPAIMLLRRYRNPLHVFRRNGRAFALTLTGAVLGPYLGITFSLIAITHTRVAIATTLMALPPVIMLPMMRYVSRELPSTRAWTGAILAVAGVAVMFLW
jgi:drug/metabolite transporter (DMT)-like permease